MDEKSVDSFAAPLSACFTRLLVALTETVKIVAIQSFANIATPDGKSEIAYIQSCPPSIAVFSIDCQVSRNCKSSFQLPDFCNVIDHMMSYCVIFNFSMMFIVPKRQLCVVAVPNKHRL